MLIGVCFPFSGKVTPLAGSDGVDRTLVGINPPRPLAITDGKAFCSPMTNSFYIRAVMPHGTGGPGCLKNWDIGSVLLLPKVRGCFLTFAQPLTAIGTSRIRVFCA